jgi:hypothetical protein
MCKIKNKNIKSTNRKIRVVATKKVHGLSPPIFVNISKMGAPEPILIATNARKALKTTITE